MKNKMHFCSLFFFVGLSFRGPVYAIKLLITLILIVEKIYKLINFKTRVVPIFHWGSFSFFIF